LLVKISGIDFESPQNGVGSPLQSVIGTTFKGTDISNSPTSDPSFKINNENDLGNPNISGTMKGIKKKLLFDNCLGHSNTINLALTFQILHLILCLLHQISNLL
jgi:hypothetical protein